MLTDLTILRTALLITLSILLVVVVFRRLRQYVLSKDMPAINHAELLGLEVQYHPLSLRILLNMPQNETLDMALLDHQNSIVFTWDGSSLTRGQHTMGLVLPVLEDGHYYFELRTSTQRTVRGFRLQQA